MSMSTNRNDIQISLLNQPINPLSASFSIPVDMNDIRFLSIHVVATAEGAAYPNLDLGISGSNQSVPYSSTTGSNYAPLSGSQTGFSATATNWVADNFTTSMRNLKLDFVPRASTAGFVDIFISGKRA